MWHYNIKLDIILIIIYNKITYSQLYCSLGGSVCLPAYFFITAFLLSFFAMAIPSSFCSVSRYDFVVRVNHTTVCMQGPTCKILRAAAWMATFSLALCSNYHQTMTKNRSLLSLRLRLGDLLTCAEHAEKACWNSARLLDAPLGPGTWPTVNLLRLVRERIFYALQVRTRTI